MSPYEGIIIAEDYTLISKLGEGSSGTVFEASYNCCEDVIVALKFFPLPSCSISYQREIYYMEQFKQITTHKDTVQIYDHFLWENYGVIVMDKFNCDLLDFLNQDFNAKKDGKKIFKQICLAVKKLHDANISHRDIKPENIFLNNVNTVSLGDFGSCKNFSNEIISTEGSYGTIWYNAPEIILNNVYNPKSADIWSLGVVLHIIFAGVWPFIASTDEILLQNLKRGEPNTYVFKELLPNDITLVNLINSMLSKDPSCRPTIDQILESDWLESCKLKSLDNRNQKPTVGSKISKKLPSWITNFKRNVKSWAKKD